jgi:hypothetical protein
VSEKAFSGLMIAEIAEEVKKTALPHMPVFPP